MLLVPRKPGRLSTLRLKCMPRPVKKGLVSLISPASITTVLKGERKRHYGLAASGSVLDLGSSGGPQFAPGILLWHQHKGGVSPQCSACPATCYWLQVLKHKWLMLWWACWFLQSFKNGTKYLSDCSHSWMKAAYTHVGSQLKVVIEEVNNTL